MPDLVADADAAPRGDTILVTDPSVEGEVIASALRAYSFHVLDVPLALLEARALGDGARVLIVDVAQAGALEVLERIHHARANEIAILCVGDAVRAAELGFGREAGSVFERPIDVDALVARVVELAQPERRDPRLRGTTPPPSFAPRRETAPPVRRESEAPPSEFPSVADPLELAGILPSLEDDALASKVPLAELSPELEAILDAAEQRVAALSEPNSAPPEEEVDLLLAPELLATLDEPLDPDDEDHGTGSGLGTPRPHQKPTGTAGTGATSMGSLVTGTGAGAATAAGTFTTTGVLGSKPAEPRVPTSPGVEARPREEPSSEPKTKPPSREELAHEPVARAAPISEAFDLRAFVVRPPAATEEEPRIATPVPPPIVAEPPPPPLPPPVPSMPRSSGAFPPSVAVAARVPVAIELPSVLDEGDALRAVARAIAGRASGALAIGSGDDVRRVVLHDGDIVTAASTLADESLVAFLVARGDLDRDALARIGAKLPPSGRHAGAALIAHGFLGQDDLWPVLRAHAEHVIGRAIASDLGGVELESEPPGRLRAEPSVFGGATGAEVFVESVRRVVPPNVALRRLGGASARLDEGRAFALLGECALRREEDAIVRSARAHTVGEVTRDGEPELVNVLYALVALGVLDALAPARRGAGTSEPAFDPLDEEAIRLRVRARLALVEDGDYFAVLGIPRTATSYEIRRAYLDLRRAFEPARLLTGHTADLAEPVRTIVEVLDEAYEILKDAHRRERYRRAIEAPGPA